MDFIKACAQEVITLNHAIENPQSTKLIFQKLPIHMRRRCMPRNSNRMPKRLREGHIRQMQKSGLPPESKRPSRKYRRRPSNLLDEYNRRQRSKIWLQTHIWHAKRFHMIEKWGYKIPHYNNDGGFRANYRAIKKKFLIQDISYYNCVELIGPNDQLIAILKTHCRYGLTFGAKCYLKGDREGSLTFFKRDGNPIGVISFIYRPNTVELRTIWIWIHPAFYNEVIEELICSFKFTLIPQTPEDDEEKIYSNDENFTMRILTHSLNRFRLSGRKSHSLLTQSLHLPKLKESNEENSMDVDGNKSQFVTWFKDPLNRSAFNLQRDIFEAIKTLNSPSQLPPHCVLGLTVLDPRFNWRSKETELEENFLNPMKIDTIDPMASSSLLWDSAVRDEVMQNYKTTKEVNDLRSTNLVPGISNDSEYNEDIMAKVPILLIQYPGTSTPGKSIGFTCGIDIILPAKWGLPFWLSFKYGNPRPIGLKEAHSIMMESLLLNSPEIHHPDTLAYDTEAKETKENLTEKYFRYPPNRRVNFIKFGISSPFFCEWKTLIKEWTDTDIVSVLRDQNIISSLTASLLFNPTPSEEKKPTPLFDDETVLKIKPLLATVKVTTVTKGNIEDFALICLPTDEDLTEFIKNRKWGGPIQISKLDEFEQNRKQDRRYHKAQLRKTMRQRQKARKAGTEIQPDSRPESTNARHARLMKRLYLPECTKVRESCDRLVMGYIVQGGFSLSRARGMGWGYVVIAPLLNLVENKSNIVLIRNTKTRQYRFATIKTIPNV